MEKHKSYYGSRKGFTIIEIMITLAIFSIVIAAIHQVFVAGEKVWDNDLSMLDMQQSTRRGLYSITREARAGSLASMSVAGGCDHIASPENCTQVTLDTPAENNILFFHDNSTNQVIRQDSLGVQRILASDITDAYFCCAHGDGDCSCNATYDTLEVRLQAEKDTLGRTLDFSLRAKIKVRND